MTSASGPTIRSVTDADRATLATFTCRDYRQSYTGAVELLVREHLADALARGDVRGLGIWLGTSLIAVAAWAVDDGDPPIATNAVLAVAHGYQRHGYARQLKKHVMQLARAEGAAAIVSDVHRDNDAMLDLNASLGANIEPADFDDHRRCTIALI